MLYLVLFLTFTGTVYSQNFNICQTNSPNYGCFQTAQQQIAIAGPNVTLYCRAVREFINCTETVACTCQLTNNPNILHFIATFVDYYDRNNCSLVLGEEVEADPGIICPGQVKSIPDEEAGLMVLALDTLQYVLALEQSCPSIKPCYKTLSDDGGVALYKKDLRGFCSVYEKFLPCFEKSTCGCGQNNNVSFVTTVENERINYNRYCAVVTNGVYFNKGIKCEGDAPVSICKQQNPIFHCYSNFNVAVKDNLQNNLKLCPAYKEYLKCTEGVACTCGLKKSVPILKGLSFAHRDYDKLGCESVSGKVEIVQGINCPDGGTTSDDILISLGLLEAPVIIEFIKNCPQVEECYKVVDVETATALHQKNADKICQSQSKFLLCLEQALCQCGRKTDTNYQSWLLQEKQIHLQLCPGDPSIFQDYLCISGASTIAMPVLGISLLHLITILLYL